MFRILFVLLSLLAISYSLPQSPKNAVVLQNTKPQTRIINGDTAQENAYPYQVGIFPNDLLTYCSGSLISENMVLTAASCLAGHTTHGAKLYFGYNKLVSTTSADQQTKSSKNIFIHPDFSAPSLKLPQNDIAIIELQSNVTLNNIVKTIKLDESTYDHTRQTGRVTGWGSTGSSNNNVADLHYVDNPIMSNDDCRDVTSQYKSQIQKSHICLAIDDGKGICGYGDSGSPLVVEGIQVGIGSFGSQTCTGLPSGFTRISEFQSWIKEKCPDCEFGKTSNNNSNTIKISSFLIIASIIIKKLL